MEGLKNNKYLIFALIFALLNMGAIFFIFGFRQYSDSQGYFNAIHFFGGKNMAVDPQRILRPLGPIIALPFEFLGEGAGLIVQNIIFYLLCVILIFKIVDLIYRDRRQALLASIFLVTATPVIESGLAYLTDMGAWFFYLLSLFLTLLYFKNKEEKLLILNAFLSGIGVLMKESGGLGVLFFGMMILLSQEFKLKEKILKIIKFGLIFSIPIILLQLFAYKIFHYTSLDWYMQNTPGAPGEGIFLTAFRYLGQLFIILGILWIPLLRGLYQEYRSRNWERIKIYLALIPSSFSFLLWSTSGSARTVFIFAPLGIILASFGCRKIKPLVLVFLISAMLCFNYYFCLVNQKITFTDIIYNFIQGCIK